jgi:uncharacterized membrane protein
LSAKAFTPRIRLEHVISFNVAVFAFGITLMALAIDIPNPSPSLTEPQIIEKLLAMSSQLERYILSFFIIAMFWVTYNQIFNFIQDSYMSIVYLNLVFLLLITLLSMPTSLIITFDSYQTAYLFYYLVVILTSSFLVVIWWHAMRIGAIDESIHPLLMKGLFIQLTFIPIVFILSIAISFVNLDIAKYFWLIIIPLSIFARLKFKH